MNKGRVRHRIALIALMLSGFVSQTFAASDPFLTLDTVLQTNGQLQFNLNGESGVSYVIEGSSDLQNWTPVLTNSDSSIVRKIAVDGSENLGFYRANRSPLPLFTAGITVKSNLVASGSSLVTDSYDSSDTNDFPGGVWNAANRRDHGDIAFGIGPASINLQNSKVMGRILTPPGTISELGLGPVGAIGDVPFVTGGGTGFESTAFFSDAFRFCLPDVAVPYTSGPTISFPGSGRTNTLSSGMYLVNGNVSFNGNLQVGTFQFVVIYVKGSVLGGRIDIQPGAVLVLYVGGTSAILNGINNPLNPLNFQYFGLPGNTAVSLSNGASFVGTVYAPEAAFAASTGGSQTNDFSGAMVANTLNVVGHSNFHYDERLATIVAPGLQR